MSAAAISTPSAEPRPSAAPPVPLYTRHTLGAIEAARDRRLRDRDRVFVHRIDARPALRVISGGGPLPVDAVPATVAARAS